MGEEQIESQTEMLGHWRSRPAAARALIVGTAALPVASSIIFALSVEWLVPEPSATVARVAWWIALFGLSSIVFLLTERVARRALPLAVLLKLALEFPGEAPSRLSIAKRAYATREIGSFLAVARSTATESGGQVATGQVITGQVITGDDILTLIAGLCARDRKTRRHAERVRSIADLMAPEVGLTREDQRRLHWAVMFHQITKLGPAFEHATLEAPLAVWLGDWAHPDGPVGEEMALGGGILAVADAYDAMTSVRSYKGPVSHDAARAEIARRGGTQFDPTVVRAFLAIPARRGATFSPATWLELLPSRFDGIDQTAVYRVGTALLVLGSVLGLAAWGASPSHATATAQGRTSGAPTGPLSSVPMGSSPSSTFGSFSASELQAITEGRSGSTSSSEHGDKPGGTKSRSRAGESVRKGGAGHSTTPTSVDPKSPSTTSPPGTTTTTGSPPGTTPPTTSSPSTTSPPRPPSTTTTSPRPPPPPPPPAAATGLTADAWCKDLLLGPQVSLHWTDSRSRSVTSYEILRSSDGSNYGVISDVGARASSFTDSGVDGLGTTYWYEVVARSPYGSATSAAVSVTTPLTCLSGGSAASGGEAGVE